jgi:glycosyltransferase involved in cell wall biosynthesis
VDVIVTLEHRFQRTPDGAVWTPGINAYDFWTRYLSVFDRVKVAARVLDVASVPTGWKRADGPCVVFHAVPYYIGPWQYLKKAIRVRTALRAAIQEDAAIIMRVSSHTAGCLESMLMRSGRPYGLEVVSDPYDVFSPGAVRGLLRPFFRWWFTRELRQQCRNAAGVAYVTERALQARYPSAAYTIGMSDAQISEEALVGNHPVFTTHYSSVQLRKGDALPPRTLGSLGPKNFRLVTVASLAQIYKAPDVLIRAVADCVRAGLDLKLDIVGDGKHRPELERLVARLGLAGRITFLGQLPAGGPVRAHLDNADLFVLASRCEGLPRAMVEAMARALPCIGSTVGGIPELLPPEDLVPPGDVGALAARIQEVLASPERMSRMSARNFVRAQDYRDEILERRRRAFFEYIRRCTEAWQERPSDAAHLPDAETNWS